MREGWLSAFPHFSELGAKDRELLERVLVVQSAPAGHVFVREGDRADAVTSAMFFLIEGQVAVDAGRQEQGFTVQRTLGPGQVFGTHALVADLPRSATCRAVSPVTYARLDRRSFEELFRKNAGLHAAFQFAIARGLAADMRALRSRLVESLATGDATALHERSPS